VFVSLNKFQESFCLRNFKFSNFVNKKILKIVDVTQSFKQHVVLLSIVLCLVGCFANGGSREKFSFVPTMTTLFGRAVARTNSMAVREPAVVVSGVLMAVGTVTCWRVIGSSS